MLAKRIDAATAAFQVGDESPSQFSREFNRLFGAPPLRDISNLWQLSSGEMGYEVMEAQRGYYEFGILRHTGRFWAILD